MRSGSRESCTVHLQLLQQKGRIVVGHVHRSGSGEGSNLVAEEHPKMRMMTTIGSFGPLLELRTKKYVCLSGLNPDEAWVDEVWKGVGGRMQ